MFQVACLTVAAVAFAWGLGALLYQTHAIAALISMGIAGGLFECWRRGWLED